MLSPIKTSVVAYNGVDKKVSFTPKQLTMGSIPDLRINLENPVNRTQIHTVYLDKPHYIISGHVIGKERLARRGFYRFQRAVRASAPKKIPRLGIKHPVSMCRWVEDYENFICSEELLGEQTFYNLLIDNNYNPFTGKVKYEFNDVIMKDGVITFAH
jgi:hypothetical protein